jgi:hypothetical protein
MTGDYAAAASQRQALALFRDAGDQVGQASAVNELGLVQLLAGDYPAAAASHQQALDLFAGIGRRVGQADALNNLGAVQRATGHYPAAPASHRQALAMSRAVAGLVVSRRVCCSLDETGRPDIVDVAQLAQSGLLSAQEHSAGYRQWATRGLAHVNSVSCASAGNCAAGGDYRGRSGAFQAFVASETNGRWGKAIQVPGSGTLNAGGYAGVSSVSCGSAGNCSAGGDYGGRSGAFQAFVASETNGRWGKAIQVPGSGSGTLNAGDYAGVNSVSCGSAGNCAAGGSYTDGSGIVQGFVTGRA